MTTTACDSKQNLKTFFRLTSFLSNVVYFQLVNIRVCGDIDLDRNLYKRIRINIMYTRNNITHLTRLLVVRPTSGKEVALKFTIRCVQH